jgi:hypothetical protein
VETNSADMIPDRGTGDYFTELLSKKRRTSSRETMSGKAQEEHSFREAPSSSVSGQKIQTWSP